MSSPLLALHRAVLRRQRSELRALLDAPTPAFRRYEAAYQRATRGPVRAVDLTQLDRALARAQVVHVGDYHTLPLAQLGYLELVQRARASGRRLVLALELFEARHQAHLDDYLAGRLDRRRLVALTGSPFGGLFDAFEPILELARQERLPVLALDSRPRAADSLQRRDRTAAGRIHATLEAHPDALVLVLAGQYHVIPAHLPAQVNRLGPRRQVVVLQNAEAPYLRLLRSGRIHRSAVRLSGGVFNLVNASPAECQRSYLEAATGRGHPAKQATAAELSTRLLALLGLPRDARPAHGARRPARDVRPTPAPQARPGQAGEAVGDPGLEGVAEALAPQVRAGQPPGPREAAACEGLAELLALLAAPHRAGFRRQVLAVRRAALGRAPRPGRAPRLVEARLGAHALFEALLAGRVRWTALPALARAPAGEVLEALRRVAGPDGHEAG